MSNQGFLPSVELTNLRSLYILFKNQPIHSQNVNTSINSQGNQVGKRLGVAPITS